MKGVVLAGGLGTRLQPMTRVTNKHLLPVYDRPMIYYPLQQLGHAGIDEILLVTGGDHAGDFLKLLRNGEDLGIGALSYAYQQGEGGIAAALQLAERFAAGESIVVLLGDNIFQKPIAPAIREYEAGEGGAMILLKSVPDAHRFGVAEVDGDRVTNIIEKPADPPTDLAVTGCYLFDSRVFDFIRDLEPSGRGELEITDVNNAYIRAGEMRHHLVDGWWTDAGTVPSLYRASELIAGETDNEVLRGGSL